MHFQRQQFQRLPSSPGKPISDEAKRTKVIDEYKETFTNPYKAAELGYIDEIIMPRQTRAKLIQALEMTQNKTEIKPAKKHGNIPL